MKYLAIFLVFVGSLFAVDEIHVDYPTGGTLYSCRFEPDGDVFLTAGSSSEIWATAGNYDVTMTENGTGGHYVGDFDVSSNIADGTYKITTFQQLGGSPADSDPAIYVGEIVWKDFAEDPGASESDVTIAHAGTDFAITIVASELAKVPKSDSTVTWNATALASVNAEVDTALADYDGPTNTEMLASFSVTDGLITTVDGNVDSILVLATFMRDVMEADVWIDTVPVPWQVVTSVKAAGGGAGGSELIRKDLKTIIDGNVTSSAERIDRTVEP